VRPAFLLLVLLAGGAFLLLVSARLRDRLRDGLEESWGSFRRSSSPGAAFYDIGAACLLSGFYRAVADDLAATAPGAVRILDLGCGPGRLTVEFARRWEAATIVGLDIDPAMLDRARARAAAGGVEGRVSFVEGDVGSLPFGDGTFDLVTSTFSLHHWPDADRGLAEAARVLAPGGVAVIYDVPGWFGEREGGSSIDKAVPVAPFKEREIGSFLWPGPLPLVHRARLADAV
jgi:SAM-dependent methyltransferase